MTASGLYHYLSKLLLRRPFSYFLFHTQSIQPRDLEKTGAFNITPYSQENTCIFLIARDLEKQPFTVVFQKVFLKIFANFAGNTCVGVPP